MKSKTSSPRPETDEAEEGNGQETKLVGRGEAPRRVRLDAKTETAGREDEDCRTRGRGPVAATTEAGRDDNGGTEARGAPEVAAPHGVRNPVAEFFSSMETP